MTYKADTGMLLKSAKIKVRRKWIPGIDGDYLAGSKVRYFLVHQAWWHGYRFGNPVCCVENEGPRSSVTGCRRRISLRWRPFKSHVGNSLDTAPERSVAGGATQKLAQRAGKGRPNCRCRFSLSRKPGFNREPRTTGAVFRKGVDGIIF